MKKKKLVSTFLLLFAFLSSALIAGDTKKELGILLEQIRKTSDKLPGLSMRIKYELFADHTTKVVEEEHTGFFIRQGKNYSMQVYGTTTVQNKDILFVKDDSNEVVLLTLPSKTNL